MHKILILACWAIYISIAYSYPVKNLTTEIVKNKNETLPKAVVNKVVSKSLHKLHKSEKLKADNNTTVTKPQSLWKSFVEKVVFDTEGKRSNRKRVQHNDTVNPYKYNSSENILSEKKLYSKGEIQGNFLILQKIHARITRSKDAVWATITLTVLCIILVIAVAQSRMWKDHHYSESQGVPLPNFNERVLFKDVMEHKVSLLKQFFKKKKRSKEKNVTELETLLPSCESDC